MRDHVLRVGGDVAAQLVDTCRELEVLLGHRVQNRLSVLPEILGLGFLQNVDVVLELSSQLRPKTHADPVMVEIQDGYLNRNLHQPSELLIKLDAKQKCKNIKASILRR